jgi:hypothetical protein
MAEGPLVHHYVNQLKKVLQGRDVQIEFRLRQAGRITYAYPMCQR